MALGLSVQEKLQFDSSSLLKNYNRIKINFNYGKGQYLFDDFGNKYIDFLSGIGVASFGHLHPQIIKSVEEQLNKLWHVSNLFESKQQERLAEILIEKTKMGSVFFCNSGTEANEAAIKFARLFGENRTDIITAVGGFHGRTYGSMSASGQLKLWQGFFPLAPGFKYVPYNDLEAIENSITRNTCAIMIEPIQGENGIVVPSNGYLKGIGKICKENNLLLIIDEVQSGIGKTGKLFAYQWEDIKPDIIATAKGIANGLPLGAVICSKKISEIIKPGMHGSTFGGNPISVTAAIEVMNLLDDHTLNKINNLSDYFLSQLKNINSSKIIDIRGKGLMLGIKFSDLIKASDIMLKLLDEGIISGTANDNVLRMLPPFVVSEDDILKFVDSLKKILN
jgi:acetylornithine aminotransferase